MGIDYDNFAADLCDTGSIALSSVEGHEYLVGSCGAKAGIKQIGKGAYRSRFGSRCLDEVELLSSRFNAALAIDLEPPVETVAFLFPRSASGRFRASGVDLGKEKLLVMPPETGTDIVVPALSGADSILISTRRFVELSTRLCLSLDPPESLAVVSVDPARNLHLRAAIPALIGQCGSSVGGEEVSNLLAELMLVLEADGGGQAPDRLLTAAARAGAVRKARAFIEQHFRRAVHMDEVCREAGVGLRTLQRGFKEYFGVSVTEYLKLVRLDSFSRALRAADPATTTVAELALNSGFTHPGRLSVEFRRQYGKSPRELLAEGASPRPQAVDTRSAAS